MLLIYTTRVNNREHPTLVSIFSWVTVILSSQREPTILDLVDLQDKRCIKFGGFSLIIT